MLIIGLRRGQPQYNLFQTQGECAMLVKKYHINQPKLAMIVVGPKPGPVPLPGQLPIPGPSSGHLPKLPPRIPQGYRTRVENGISYLVIRDKGGSSDYGKFPQQFAKRYGNAAVPAPGLEAIGCGYDVFSSYATSASLKRRLFDMGKMGSLDQTNVGTRTYNHWPIVTVHPLSDSVRRPVTGSTFLEYTEELTVSAGMSGGFLGFHAEAEGEYSRAQTRSQYNAFANVCDVTRVFALHLMDRNDLRDFLTPEALAAIDNVDGTWSPDRLFDEFGLYFLTGAIVGGRLTYTSIVDKFYLRSDTDVELMAEADYLSIVGGSSAYHSSSSFTSYQTNSLSEMATIGGDPSMGGGSIRDDASYQRWKDSVLKNPYFIDFTLSTVKRPLTPIWTLARDARRAELEARAPEYIRAIVDPFGARHAIDMTRRMRSYLVTTHTGVGDSDGTPGNVYVKLSGRDLLGNPLESGKLHHKLSGGRHRKGAADSVSFSVPDLGVLTTITVFQENVDNETNGWGLDTIDVVSQENMERRCASCYTWLSDANATFTLHP